MLDLTIMDLLDSACLSGNKIHPLFSHEDPNGSAVCSMDIEPNAQ